MSMMQLYSGGLLLWNRVMVPPAAPTLQQHITDKETACKTVQNQALFFCSPQRRRPPP